MIRYISRYFEPSDADPSQEVVETRPTVVVYEDSTDRYTGLLDHRGHGIYAVASIAPVGFKLSSAKD